MKKTVLLLLSGLILAACAPKVVPPALPPSDNATIKLAEAANSISKSLHELERIQAVATPPIAGKRLDDPDSFGINGAASIDWTGPIGPLMSRLAHSSHFRLRVLGHQPAIPIIITLSAHNAPLGDIIQDVDFQAGERAEIRVLHHRHVIELRYAKA